MVRLKLLVEKKLLLLSTVHEWLVACSVFSFMLLCVRIIATTSLAYVNLAWNLLLAFIPYLISCLLNRYRFITENRIPMVAVLFVWLLFVPNSFYIVTDLFHLDQFDSAPKWFDLLLILSFSWNGILCGVISLGKIEIILSNNNRKQFSFLMVCLVMWLNAFGIYIGRYLRYNSWDVITNPFSLISETGNIIFHPFQNFPAWGMTSCYSVFMVLIYYSIKKASESIQIY